MGVRETLEGLKVKLERELAEINAGIAELAAKRKSVHVIAILDKSASMGHLTTDTIGGFNNFIAEQRKNTDTDLAVTLVQFASPQRARGGAYPSSGGDYQVVFSGKPINEVPLLTRDTYRADGGSTALNDAIGKTLSTLNDSHDAYVVLLITDGAENDSIHFTRDQARELIKSLEARGKFTFVFIGSDPSTWGEAAAYGATVSNTLRYEPNGVGVNYSYTVASRGLDMLRSSVSVGASYMSESLVSEAEAAIVADATIPPLTPTISTASAAPPKVVNVPPSLSTDSTGKGI